MNGHPLDEILELATLEDKALVTCTIRDFAILDRAWLAAGRQHSGNSLPAPGQCRFL
ncbi:MAG: hypothetical protein Q8M17_13670 [Actinomycetota bacterium]|nr:hypothetical protein [Actinomycetota bacterium]